MQPDAKKQNVKIVSIITESMWGYLRQTDLVSLWIKVEVGPVRISLHVSELKKLSQAQDQDLLTNLTEATKEEKQKACGYLEKNIMNWHNELKSAPLTDMLTWFPCPVVFGLQHVWHVWQQTGVNCTVSCAKLTVLIPHSWAPERGQRPGPEGNQVPVL